MPRRRPTPGTWERIVAHSRGVARGAGEYTEDDFVAPADSHPANVVTSLCTDGMHRPVIDIDFPVVLKPSGTPGHFHLFLNGPGLTWEQYETLLVALRDAGLVEPGYAGASIRQGRTCVRLPGVHRPPRIEPEPSPPEPPSERLEPSYWSMTAEQREAMREQAFRDAVTAVTPTTPEPLTLEALTEVARRYRQDHGWQGANPPLVVTPDQYEALRRDFQEHHPGPHGVGFIHGGYGSSGSGASAGPRTAAIYGMPIEVRENGRLMRRVVDTETVTSVDQTFQIPTTVRYEPVEEPDEQPF